MITRLTLATKRLTHDLMQTGSSMADQYSKKAMVLWKALVPSSENIEALLITPAHMVMHSTAMKALKDAAPAFQELESFYRELEALVKSYNKMKEKGTKEEAAYLSLNKKLENL